MEAYPILYITTNTNGDEFVTVSTGNGTGDTKTIRTKTGIGKWTVIEMPSQDINQPIYIY